MSKSAVSSIRDSMVRVDCLDTTLTVLPPSALDVAEPLDYEDYVYEHQADMSRDALRHIYTVPADDVAIETIPRHCRTLAPVLPDSLALHKPLVAACVNCLTSPFVKCERAYAHCVHNDASIPPLPARPEYDVDTVVYATPELPELSNSLADSLLSPTSGLNADEARPRDLFNFYPTQREEDFIERRERLGAPGERHGHRLSVKVQQLKLLCEVEPIFCSLALYDVKEKKRISENFYFDFIAEEHKQLLSRHIPCQQPSALDPYVDVKDISTLSRSCIFSVSQPNADIFLVLKLEKVLQPTDLAEAADIYTKEDKGRLERFKTLLPMTCDRLGRFRMPLGWAAINISQVVTSNERMGSLRRTSDISQHVSDPAPNFATFDKKQIKLEHIYRAEVDRISDEELIKLLSDFKKPSAALRKLRQLPAQVIFDLAPAPAEPPCALTPELYRLKPYPEEKVRPTKEVLEFSPHPLYRPLAVYRNLLYIYPRHLNFSGRANARNIAVRIQLLAGEEPINALPVIFGRSSCAEFTSEAHCAVLHHNKTPYFADEVKIALPAHVSPEHHLLFTFFHLSCDVKKKERSVESAVGYVWLPLLTSKGLLLQGDVPALPVALERLPVGYSRMWPDPQQCAAAKWTEKAVFQVSLSARSSLYPPDEAVSSFLQQYFAYDSGEIRETTRLITATLALQYADYAILVEFLPVVISSLLSLLTTPRTLPSKQLCNIVLETLCGIASQLTARLPDQTDSLGRSRLLLQHIQFAALSVSSSRPSRSTSQPAFGDGTDTFSRSASLSRSVRDGQTGGENGSSPAEVFIHDTLVDAWTLAKPDESIAASNWPSKEAVRRSTLASSWLLYDIVMKSILQYLSSSGRLDMPRKMRFPESFNENLLTLVNGVIQDLIASCHDDVAIRANIYLAHFLADLFSIIDRGFVLQLVANYCKTLNSRMQVKDHSQLLRLQLDFLRVICSYEHYVPLNLPMAGANVSPTPSVASETSANSIAPLTNAFRRHHFLTGLTLNALTVSLELPELHQRAVNVLRNLFTTHDQDPRYLDGEVRGRLATLYFPLLSLVCEWLPHLHQMNKSFELVPWGREDDDMLLPEPHRRALGLETTRHLLVSTLWVLKNLSDCDTRRYLTESPPMRLTNLLRVLEIATSVFEYRAAGPCRSVRAIEQLERDYKKLERRGINKPGLESPRRLGVDAVAMRPGKKAPRAPDAAEAHLAAETSMIVLDTLDTYLSVLESADSSHLLLVGLVRLTLHLLNTNQAISVLNRLFAMKRQILNKFPELYLEREPELCADLCVSVLRHCAAALPPVRVTATATVYQLMRLAFGRGALARVKVQLIKGLSALVGRGDEVNVTFLCRSLASLLAHADADTKLRHSTFPEQVRELVRTLHAILSDTVKMLAAGDDHETLMDLMFRVALSYQRSPDLRLTWLQNMATKHSERGQYAESAQCLIHCAALVSEFLQLMENRRYLPAGAVSFEELSDNVVTDESAVGEDLVSPHEHGVCTDKMFTEGGLVALVEHAVSQLQMADLHELVYMLYKVIVPYYEHHRDFKKLSTIYEKVSDSLKLATRPVWKRRFWSYFRVGFYGKLFGELASREFVYKEAGYTRLSEISNTLQALYESRFGVGIVEVLKDSRAVTVSDLDPLKAYIQITFVEPYFDAYELHEFRKADFERHYNLREFTYSTPFTQSGKAHGRLDEQFKRKTILMTVQSFPYLKTRLEVAEQRELVLSPIEVAIDDIQKKTAELTEVLAQQEPDPKILQMILQGCVSVSVNQGPLEIASVFLLPVQQGIVIPHQGHHKLQMCFKELLKRCGNAIHTNSKLVGEDQRAYQAELEKSYRSLKEQLDPLLVSTVQIRRQISIGTSESLA